MSDEERPTTGSDSPGDAAKGKREGNPLEREISYARQRGAVLRPGRSGYTPRRVREQTEAGGEDPRPGTFRQQRVAEYRERQRAHDEDARDESEQDG